MGIKVVEYYLHLNPKKTKRKRGRNSDNVALKELQVMMINSGKMQALSSTPNPLMKK